MLLFVFGVPKPPSEKVGLIRAPYAVNPLASGENRKFLRFASRLEQQAGR